MALACTTNMVADFTSLSQGYYVNRKGIDLTIVTILDDIHFSKPPFQPIHKL